VGGGLGGRLEVGEVDVEPHSIQLRPLSPQHHGERRLEQVALHGPQGAVLAAVDVVGLSHQSTNPPGAEARQQGRDDALEMCDQGLQLVDRQLLSRGLLGHFQILTNELTGAISN